MVDVAPSVGLIRDGGIGTQIQLGQTIAPASGYVQGVDAYGNAIVMTEGTKPTYSAGATALAVVTGATDFWQLSAVSKTVRILRIGITGTASIAVIVPVILFRRPTQTTAGTPASGLALPVAAVHDTANSAATATLNAWTANPTVTTTGQLTIRTAGLACPVNTDATSPSAILWDFTTRNGQGLVLRAGQYAALNLNAAAISTASFNIDVEWTEE